MKASISELITYPIKSCGGIRHQSVGINPQGLAGDRQYMLIDDNGVFISQRHFPSMALIQPSLGDSSLEIMAPGMDKIIIDSGDFIDTASAAVWKSQLEVDVAKQQVAAWFSDYLKHSVRLVRYGSKSHRNVDQDYAHHGETVAFADGYPVLVTHQTTLKNLNEYLSEPVGMDRFRANIVVTSDSAAWDEMQWSSLSHDDFSIDLVKPCARCVMTGVEQSTGTNTGVEIFQTLAKKLPQNGKAIFGINGLPRIGMKPPLLTTGLSLKIA